MLLAALAEVVVNARRDPQGVSVAQQHTTTALTNERAIPVSTISGQIFCVDQRRDAI
jgi:hypothetical protein